MRILIFGENGQVARCLSEETGAHEAVVKGRDAVDLMTPGAAKAAIEHAAPDAVINAAAYTAVDKAEDDRDAAYRLNAEAVGEIAEAAQRANAALIHISTDYVFDGKADGPYKEGDATNPLNVYGASKLEGERAAMDAHPECVILRTSWVFSEYGGNFVKTMLRLGAERDALSIVDDQIGGPTYARDIARVALAIAGKKHRGAPGNGLYHFQGAPSVSWAGFAARIFEIVKLDCKAQPIPTADYPTLAARPLRTILDCSKIERDFGVGQPDWRTGLRQTLSALQSKESQP